MNLKEKLQLYFQSKWGLAAQLENYIGVQITEINSKIYNK